MRFQAIESSSGLDKSIGQDRIMLQAMAVITVEDTGVGIPEKNFGMIFDPFSPQKKSGRNRLGLSIVYGILQQHQGSISVESKVGEGTRFIIRLPLHQTGVKETIRTKGSRILIVDDEQIARENLDHILKKEGYETVSVESGIAALQELDKREFDLVLTDLKMQIVDGLQVLEKAKELYPDTESYRYNRLCNGCNGC